MLKTATDKMNGFFPLSSDIKELMNAEDKLQLYAISYKLPILIQIAILHSKRHGGSTSVYLLHLLLLDSQALHQPINEDGAIIWSSQRAMRYTYRTGP